jgi:hypothetical protein
MLEPMKSSGLVVVVCVLGTTCGGGNDPSPLEPPPAPVPRAILTIVVETSGQEIDADGFFLTVDGNILGLETNGSREIRDLLPGTHQVSLSGLAPNCRLPRPPSQSFTLFPEPDESWEETRAVELGVGGAETKFSVTCFTTGTLRLVVLNSALRIRDFRVVLTHDPRKQVVEDSAETTIPYVSSGLHTIKVYPAKCIGPITNQQIRISTGDLIVDTVRANVPWCY